MSDWDPGTYSRFRDLRFRPLLDLLARVPDLPPGDLVDLGCGTGVAGPVLKARFPGRRLVGLDLSPTMLAEARAAGTHDLLEETDAAQWHPASPPALIFSNAALHWLPDHRQLFLRLAALLPPGGVLAVQMPAQEARPSHSLIHETARRLFPGRFDAQPPRRVEEAVTYHRLLAGHGTVEIWVTDYLQRLAPVTAGHPVRSFTQSTAARPVLDALDAADQVAFLAAYDAALAEPYPAEADGTVLFPFRRLFIIFCCA